MTADRYAVIGDPVTHSLSPRIHAAFAGMTGQAMHYGKVEAPAFLPAAAEFLDSGGSGLNVTVPFKVDAWRWVDGHDEAAATAGAVNTIVAAGTGWRGCNTDGIGFVRDLERNLGWDLAGARVLVLGAGGAVQGILAPLRDAGVSGVTLANRTHARARALADAFGVRAVDLADLPGGWDIVVNGTSAGLAGVGGVVAPHVVAGSRCYDLLYRADGATPFCRWAGEHDALAVSDGLGMLVEQAAAAFSLWRGVTPETGGVVASLRAGGARA